MEAKWQERTAILTVAAVFATAFTYPLLKHLLQSGPGADRDYFTETAWAAAYTFNHFGQLPFWDPYKCGGVPLLADPQSRIFTPFFLLHLIYGPITAIKLELTIHLAIAWVGGYVLGRLLGLGCLAAAVCASVFPASSWIYLHFAAAHITFVAGLYLPWVLSMWVLAADRRQLLPAAIGGLFAALIFMEGGFYCLSFAAPLFATVALVTAVQRRQAWPVFAVLMIAVFALGFSSVKLLPTLVLHISRGTSSSEVESLGMLFQELFSRNQDAMRWLDGIQWGFYEYGAYLGPFFAGLALLGAFSGRARALPWLAGAIVMLVLSLGSPVWWAPWSLLHKLPPFDFEHVPSRFLIIFILALAPLAGMGAQALCNRGRLCTAITAVILVAALLDSWEVNKINLQHALEGQMPAPLPYAKEFRQMWDVSGRQTYYAAVSNQGSLNCFAMNILGLHAVAYNQPGYRGEQYLLGDGTVTLTSWTPNALSLEVQIPSTTILVINQNYESGWQLVNGRGEIFSRSGLIAVILPPGQQHLDLAYSSRAFVKGLTITLLTFVPLFGIWLFERSRFKRGDTVDG